MKILLVLCLTLWTLVNDANCVVCWDTGCQLNSWAVRGCQQYGMIETTQKPCPDGIVYSCCEPNDTSSSPSSRHTRPICWDTGCQLDSWAVRGCQQYGMVETGQRRCADGVVYSCCETTQHVTDAAAAAASGVRPKCWDTGCQLDSWAVRGCQHYGMVEVGRRSCTHGIVFSCCEPNATTTASGIPLTSSSSSPSSSVDSSTSSPSPSPNSSPLPPSTTTDSLRLHKSVCWDTGCQLDSWAVRGCQQYDMVEVGRRWCADGIVYSCCEKNHTSTSTPAVESRFAAADASTAAAALKSGVVDERFPVVSGGADKHFPVVTATETVTNETASNGSTNSSSTTPRPLCWDTGCQLDSWAVRGCEQYNMTEVGQRPCAAGIVYSCCEKNGSTSAAPSPTAFVKPKCWDTGCQLDSWAVRGCEQYGMLETGQRPCPSGIVYSCCEPNQTSSLSSSSSAGGNGAASAVLHSKPKCWDTGCQPESWLVRGCEQYDMLEVGQTPCPNGLIYSCCDRNITTAPPPKQEQPACWDTGCQLDSWAVRGCQQYGMLEVGQKPCPDGIVYSCCRNNATVASTAGQSAKKCWDTGCQLDVWTTRGCEQYGMVEKAQRPCLNGIVFSCCRP